MAAAMRTGMTVSLRRCAGAYTREGMVALPHCDALSVYTKSHTTMPMR